MSDDTPTVTNNVVTLGKVTIGSAAGGVQYQKAANSKEHIAGENYPMYGKVQNLAKSKNPAANMKHLSALVAVKVVNEGHGEDITIENVEFEAKEDIVGDFTLKMPASGDHTFTGQGTAEAKKAKVAFSDPETNFSSVTIAKNESTTLYLAVKPFTVKSGASLTIRVNGSARTVKMSKDVTFEAGKVTTIKVPVKTLVFPTESDALTAKTASNENMLTLDSKTDRQVCANGKIVSAYEVGNGSNGSLTIYGQTTDMVNALDVGFFASTWKDKPAAMTVSNINVWFPYNGNLVKISEYQPLKDILKSELKGDISWDFTGILTNTAIEFVMASLSSGIPRDKDSSLDFVYLTRFIDPQTITFNGVVSNGAAMPTSDSEITNVLILDEEPVYKEIKGETVDNLFKTRFAYKDKSTNVTTYPTFAGMLDIVNGTNTSGEADVTAQTLYNKLYDTVAAKGTLSMSAAGQNITINMANVFNALIPSVDKLKEILPQMKFSITITTCPYHADKAKGYGSKASPIALSKITGDLNPILFWGFDVYADNSSK